MSEYKCSSCNYTSKTKWNVKNHINKVCKDATLEENIIKVKCDICNKMFDTNKLLNQHKEKCFEKRTVTISKFLDPEKIEEAMTNMMTLINSLQNDNKKLTKVNNELETTINKLTQRLDKLEKANKNGYEETDNQDAVCEYVDTGEFIPTSKAMVDDKCGVNNIFSVEIKGQIEKLTGMAKQEHIKVGNTMYMYDKKGVTRSDIKWAGHLKIKTAEECVLGAKYKNSRGAYYCEEHIHF